jgi:hypothetical protein
VLLRTDSRVCSLCGTGSKCSMCIDEWSGWLGFISRRRRKHWWLINHLHNKAQSALKGTCTHNNKWSGYLVCEAEAAS